jgi:site-specific recombinase XerD
MPKQSIHAAAESFLAKIERKTKGATAQHTHRAYRKALLDFLDIIERSAKIQVTKTPITQIESDWIVWYIEALQDQGVAPATEQARLAAVRGFYKHVSLLVPEINLTRLEVLINDYKRPLPQNEILTTDEDVEKILQWAWDVLHRPFRSQQEKLRAYRNRAFLVLLADTGLRVSEACRLRLSHLAQVSGRNMQFTLKIKGGRDAVIRLSKNAWNAIRAYHRVRADLDKKSELKPEQLPVFAQHSHLADLNAKKKRKTALVRPWTDAGARQMLEQANIEVFGDDYRLPDPDDGQKTRTSPLRGRVTPHSLRRYFVRRIYNRQHDLRKAQLLARHRSITTTQRYIGTSDAELEATYREAVDFDEK